MIIVNYTLQIKKSFIAYAILDCDTLLKYKSIAIFHE